MKVLNKTKICIIVTVAVLAVGIILASVIGFNNACDYKKSYEVVVSVDQNANGSSELVKIASEEYFDKFDIKVKKYATETLNEGDSYIFKIKDGSKIDEADFKLYIDKKLDIKESTIDFSATVKVYETNVTSDLNLGFVVLALGITAVIAFAYLFFVEKFASAVTVFASSVVSALMFVALLGITRVPAYPMFGYGLALAFAFGLIISTVLVNRFKETIKTVGNEKLSCVEIVEKGIKDSFIRVVFICASLVLLSLTFFILGIFAKSFLFLGLQLLISTIASVFAGYILTPVIWSFVKRK